MTNNEIIWNNVNMKLDTNYRMNEKCITCPKAKRYTVLYIIHKYSYVFHTFLIIKCYFWHSMTCGKGTHYYITIVLSGKLSFNIQEM